MDPVHAIRGVVLGIMALDQQLALVELHATWHVVLLHSSYHYTFKATGWENIYYIWQQGRGFPALWVEM